MQKLSDVVDRRLELYEKNLQRTQNVNFVRNIVFSGDVKFYQNNIRHNYSDIYHIQNPHWPGKLQITIRRAGNVNQTTFLLRNYNHVCIQIELSFLTSSW